MPAPTFDYNPFATATPVYFDSGGKLIPQATAPGSAAATPAAGGGFWSGLGSILAPVAQTAGILAVSKAIGTGRSPGAEQFGNPLSAVPGASGQPGTTPVGVSPQIIPGVNNTSLYIGLGALVVVGVLAVVIAKR